MKVTERTPTILVIETIIADMIRMTPRNVINERVHELPVFLAALSNPTLADLCDHNCIDLPACPLRTQMIRENLYFYLSQSELQMIGMEPKLR